MTQLIAHHDGGQGGIHVGQIVQRRHDDLRQLHRQQIQHHGRRHAEHTGVQQDVLPAELSRVVSDHIDARRPRQHCEHHHIGRAVEHADAAQHGQHQGIAHKAAVGEHRAELQDPGRTVLAPDQHPGQQDADGVKDHRQQQAHQKIVQIRRVPFPLEGHHHHGGGHRVHHQVRDGQTAPVVHQPDLAQHEAHRHQGKQDQHLLAHC